MLELTSEQKGILDLAKSLPTLNERYYFLREVYNQGPEKGPYLYPVLFGLYVNDKRLAQDHGPETLISFLKGKNRWLSDSIKYTIDEGKKKKGDKHLEAAKETIDGMREELLGRIKAGFNFEYDIYDMETIAEIMKYAGLKNKRFIKNALNRMTSGEYGAHYGYKALKVAEKYLDKKDILKMKTRVAQLRIKYFAVDHFQDGEPPLEASDCVRLTIEDLKILEEQKMVDSELRNKMKMYFQENLGSVLTYMEKGDSSTLEVIEDDIGYTIKELEEMLQERNEKLLRDAQLEGRFGDCLNYAKELGDEELIKNYEKVLSIIGKGESK